MLGRFKRFFTNPFRGDSLEREVEDELAFHLEQKEADLIASGLSPEEARRRARKDFGSLPDWRRRALRARRASQKRIHRRQTRVGIVQDMRLALRQLRRRPGFSLATVAIMGLGIGVSGAVGAALDAVLFRPLPYPESDRLVMVGLETDRGHLNVMTASIWDGILEAQQSLELVTLTRVWGGQLDEPRRYIDVGSVDSNFFRLLGAEPYLGRVMLPKDDASDAPSVVVLSHEIWSGLFEADPEIVGSTISINGAPQTVIGVLGPEFRWPKHGGSNGPPFYQNTGGVNADFGALRSGLRPMGRLKEGVSVEQAQAELERIGRTLAETDPRLRRALDRAYEAGAVAEIKRLWGITPMRSIERISLQPYRHYLTSRIQDRLGLILATAVLLLLVVTVNVSGLILSGAMDRSRELAIRSSLGAGRARLALDVATQSGILTLAGLVLGLGLVKVLIPGLIALSPGDIPLLDTAALDGRVAAGAVLVAAVVWVAGAAIPAYRAGGNTGFEVFSLPGRFRPKIRFTAPGLIAVAQAVAATTLLSGAAVLVHATGSWLIRDPGLNPEGVHILRLWVSDADFLTTVDVRPELIERMRASRVRFLEVVRVDPVLFRAALEPDLDALRRVPGVADVAYTSFPPMMGSRRGGHRVAADPEWTLTAARLVQYDENPEWFEIRYVTPNLFDVLQMRLVRGELLPGEDERTPGGVAVANEAFVEQFVPDPEPVGARVRIRQNYLSEIESVEIVGVVANTYRHPQAPAAPTIYLPLTTRAELWPAGATFERMDASYVVRWHPEANPDPGLLSAALRPLGREVPVGAVETLAEVDLENTGTARFLVAILGAFGAVGLLLSGVTLFTLLAQYVRSRQREIGVRRAVGASGLEVVLRILRGGVGLTMAGLVLGLGASYFVVRLLAATVWGVQGWSLVPLLMVVATLAATGTLASWFPAYRASQVDPKQVLMAE